MRPGGAGFAEGFSKAARGADANLSVDSSASGRAFVVVCTLVSDGFAPDTEIVADLVRAGGADVRMGKACEPAFPSFPLAEAVGPAEPSTVVEAVVQPPDDGVPDDRVPDDGVPEDGMEVGAVARRAAETIEGAGGAGDRVAEGKVAGRGTGGGSGVTGPALEDSVCRLPTGSCPAAIARADCAAARSLSMGAMAVAPANALVPPDAGRRWTRSPASAGGTELVAPGFFSIDAWPGIAPPPPPHFVSDVGNP